MPARHPAGRYAGLALVVLALIWGYNWVVMKRVLDYVSPLDFVALRSGCGCLCLFVMLRLQGKSLRPVALQLAVPLGLLQIAGFMGLIQLALASGGAGKTAVLAYTMPFWMLLLARLFLGERIRGLQWLAVALAGLGLVLILEPWHWHGTLLSSVLALGAGLVWASSAIVTKRLRPHYPADLLALTAWQMLFGALTLIVLALLLPGRPLQPSGYFIAALAYNALLGTALGWWLWLFVLDSLPAGVAGLSMLAVPSVGVLASWLQLGETPSLLEGLGMATVMAALALLAGRGLRQSLQVRRSNQDGLKS